MGGNFSKLEREILQLEEKIRNEDSNVKRYELRRIFRRKIAKLENRKKDARRRLELRRQHAILS